VAPSWALLDRKVRSAVESQSVSYSQLTRENTLPTYRRAQCAGCRTADIKGPPKPEHLQAVSHWFSMKTARLEVSSLYLRRENQ